MILLLNKKILSRRKVKLEYFNHEDRINILRLPNEGNILFSDYVFCYIFYCDMIDFHFISLEYTFIYIFYYYFSI